MNKMMTSINIIEGRQDGSRALQPGENVGHEDIPSTPAEVIPRGVGMENLGLSCYHNATLQSLFHVPSFVEWIKEDKIHENNCPDTCIVCALKTTFVSSNFPIDQCRVIKPTEIWNRLKLIAPRFVYNRQEDAHEFLVKLIEKLTESDSKTRNALGVAGAGPNEGPMHLIFGGTTMSEVACTKCQTVSTTSYATTEMELDVKSATSLKDLLDGYIESDSIQGYGCETCKVPVPAKKYLSIGELPNVLSFHIKRFTADGSKIRTKINCPLEMNMIEYVHPSKKNDTTICNYKLVSAIIHGGSSIHSGHYFTVGVAEDGLYYVFNDTIVQPTPDAATVCRDATVLFYELDNGTPLNRELQNGSRIPVPASPVISEPAAVGSVACSTIDTFGRKSEPKKKNILSLTRKRHERKESQQQARITCSPIQSRPNTVDAKDKETPQTKQSVQQSKTNVGTQENAKQTMGNESDKTTQNKEKKSTTAGGDVIKNNGEPKNKMSGTEKARMDTVKKGKPTDESCDDGSEKESSTSRTVVLSGPKKHNIKNIDGLKIRLDRAAVSTKRKLESREEDVPKSKVMKKTKEELEKENKTSGSITLSDGKTYNLKDFNCFAVCLHRVAVPTKRKIVNGGNDEKSETRVIRKAYPTRSSHKERNDSRTGKQKQGSEKSKRGTIGLQEPAKERASSYIDKQTFKRTKKDADAGKDQNKKDGLSATLETSTDDQKKSVAVKKKEYKYKCTICIKTFASEFRRDQHIKTDHGPDRTHHCPECGADFFTYISLRNHKYNCHNARRVPCKDSRTVKKKQGSEKSTRDTVGLQEPGNQRPSSHVDKQSFKRKKVNADDVNDQSKKDQQSATLETSTNTNKKEYKYKCTICIKTFASEFLRDQHVKTDHGPDRTHHCPECGADFFTYISLRNHKYNCHNDRRFPCKYDGCDKVYGNAITLNNHIKQIHITGHRCTVCDKEFGSYGQMLYHRKTHKKEEEHHCPSCEKVFPTIQKLKAHVRNVHEARKGTFICNICDSKLATQVHLLRHIRIMHPTIPGTWECNHCPKTFNAQEYLAQHIKQMHTGNFSCPECPSNFTSATSLKRHVQHEHSKENPCPSCYKVFPTIKKLKAHVQYVHEARKGTFICKICDSELATQVALLKHIRTVHPPIPGTWECKHCQKTYNAQEYLSQHVLQVHTIGDFSCLECSSHFTCAKSLTNHIKYVHGKGHYACLVEKCNAVFSSKIKLKHHIGAVHVDPAHYCEYCATSFKTKKQLSQHQKYVHSTNRQHKCQAENCKLKFKRYHSLISHHRFVHEKVKLHECETCGFAFQQNNDLLRHKKFVHGEEVNKENKRKLYPCNICKPQILLPNNATWNWHRLEHHYEEYLAPGDPKEFEEIITSSINKILVSGSKEVYSLASQMGDSCRACDIKFYNSTAKTNHVWNYHTLDDVTKRDFENVRWDCRHKQELAQWMELMDQLYVLSEKAFSNWTNRRKVYDLMFVPETLPDENIRNYIRDPQNTFFMYTGSMLVSRSAFVSLHHTNRLSTDAIVSTNYFMFLTKNADPKYKAVLVNEKYIEEGTSESLFNIKKEEAKDMLTLFIFAKVYDRDDVFFQALEWGEIKKFSIEEIAEIIDQVYSCQGILTNLPRFEISMTKRIQISTAGVNKRKCDFATCRRCKSKTIFPSKFHSTKHKILEHNEEPTNLTEHLIRMAEPLSPHDIFKLCLNISYPAKYWVYLAIGSNERISTIAEALMLDTEGYVGQSTGPTFSNYHLHGDHSNSGLQALKGKYEYVYILFNWKSEINRDMYRAEMSLMVQGSSLFCEAVSAGRAGIKLINQHFPVHLICSRFSRDEWKELADSCTTFDCQLPSFLSHLNRLDVLKDITHLIP